MYLHTKIELYVTMQLCTYVQLYLHDDLYVNIYVVRTYHIAMKFTNAVINNH